MTHHEADINDFDCYSHDTIDGTEKIEIHGNIAIVGYLATDYDNEHANPRSPDIDNFGKLKCFDNNHLCDQPTYRHFSSTLRYTDDEFEIELAAECDPQAAKMINYWQDDCNPFLELIRNNPNLEDPEEAAEEAAKTNILAAVEQGLNKALVIPIDILSGPYTIIRAGHPGDISPNPEENRGCDGYMFATPQMIIDEWGEDTPETREKALNLMLAELESYNQWLAGEVYGVCVYAYQNTETDPDAPPVWEEIEEDECWGFLGHEHAEEELDRLFMEMKDCILNQSLPQAA